MSIALERSPADRKHPSVDLKECKTGCSFGCCNGCMMSHARRSCGFASCVNKNAQPRRQTTSVLRSSGTQVHHFGRPISRGFIIVTFLQAAVSYLETGGEARCATPMLCGARRRSPWTNCQACKARVDARPRDLSLRRRRNPLHAAPPARR
jgi:hypothetical protein